MKLAKAKSIGAFQAGPIVKKTIEVISALSAEDRHVEAEAKARELYRQFPGRADVNDALSLCLLDQRRFDEALPLAEAAVKLEPKNPAFLVNLGRLYLDREMIEDALPILERAVSCRPSPSEASWALASFYFKSGKAERSIEHYERALETADKETATHIRFSYFDALSALGRIGEAEKVIGELLRVPDAAAMATIRATSLRKHVTESAPFKQLLALRDVVSAEPNVRTRLYLGIGKIYENSKAYDDGFASYAKAKEGLSWSESVESFTQEVDAQIRAFPYSVFAKYAEFGNLSEQPVFVVGMPRSGTTLVEQIIAAHPEAGGAGELARMRSLFGGFADATRPESIFDVFKRVGPEKWNDVPNLYLRLINHLCPGKSRIVDKMPHNFVIAGFLALCFPCARIVHVFRNPADNFISAFQNAMNSFHGYSYDQVSFATYYLQYVRLMNHWKSVLPRKIFDLSYDELVTSPEPEAKKLVDFIGLDWNDSCLRFHERETTVRTISKLQVRQPIYAGSLTRWKNYEKHLGPLLAILGARQTGYFPLNPPSEN